VVKTTELVAATEALPWLPAPAANWSTTLANLDIDADDIGGTLQHLATAALNVNQLTNLGKRIDAVLSQRGELKPFPSFKLTVLSNATISLAAHAIPASTLRHGVATRVNVVEYERLAGVAMAGDPDIQTFKPDAVLLALDYRGLPLATLRAGEPAVAIVDEAVAYLRSLRDGIRRNFQAPVIFQTLATPPGALFGSFDLRVSGTLRTAIAVLNEAIVALAEDGDFILDVAGLVHRVGAERWFDEPQWLAHKVAFNLAMIPAYADHVGRLIGAIRGRSRKCLVLDLDNTLWGGAIGDEGLSGIELGQGSPDGEAFLAVQQMALALRNRGILLAVCSKNDDANARLPFREHPDMLLNEHHIAAFHANWTDKVSNLEAIAKSLNIGLDALVLLDDNPAERAQVRKALPAVATPEIGNDPSTYAWTILSAGYFEAVSFLDEDKRRAEQYTAEFQRVKVMEGTRDFGDYLSELDMTISFAPFDPLGRARISQLINKSNQFNLTTRRYTEVDVANFEADPSVLTLQVRLRDRFGDSGMIAVLIARRSEYLGQPAFDIDTWLMSCRVLGRKVEEAMLRELAQNASAASVRWIIGRYYETARNGMVKEHYARLGFSQSPVHDDKGGTAWLFDVSAYQAPDLPMTVDRSAVTDRNDDLVVCSQDKGRRGAGPH
jgi:FkbH-like protein